MCVVWQKTLSKNVLKPAQECPAQQLKSSSPQSSEARSPVTLPASKWNAVHSSLISHTGSLTSWPPHSSVGFRGFEIICAAFLLQDPRCLCDQHDKTHRKELGRVVSPHPVTPFFFIFLSLFPFFLEPHWVFVIWATGLLGKTPNCTVIVNVIVIFLLATEHAQLTCTLSQIGCYLATHSCWLSEMNLFTKLLPQND